MAKYIEEHKDEITSYQKQYYDENRVELTSKQKQYNENHKVEIAANKKQYYDENKDEILANKKQKVKCVCGCEVAKVQLTNHMKTVKHLTAMANV